MALLDRLRRDAPAPVAAPVPSAVTVKRSFFASAFSRLFGAWTTTLASADSDVQEALAALRARHRDLCDNNPLAAAAVRAFVENVAGPDGMLCTPLVTTRSGDLRARVNRQLADAFAAWGQRGICTVDGRSSWVDVQRLVVRTWRTDGEVFVRFHRGRAVNRFGFALQLIDPDLVDHTHNQPRARDRNEIRMGVELDQYERPVAYHVFTEHPSLRANRTRVRIPASEMLHVFEQRRPGQTRGVPAGVAVMGRLKMLDQFQEFALGAAQLTAGMAVMFEQDKDGPALLGEDGQPIETDIPSRLEAAMGKLLPPGVKPFTLAAEHPTANYEPFVRASTRDIATGYGLAYSSVTGDLTQASYGSMRDGSLKERDLFRGYHRWLAAVLCVPVYQAWLEQAVLMNAVTLPSQRSEDWQAVQFSGRGWTWIDPEKDIRAVERQVKLGLASRQDIARSMGRNYEDVLRETSEDLAKAAEWGVPVGGIDALATDTATAPTPAVTADPFTPEGGDDA
jgi:lambda family phage portal protein